MKRSTWVIVALVAIVVAAAGLWWARRGRSEPVRFRTVALERGTIESTVSATGTVNPVEQVEVGSQVSGTVARLGADYNSRVRRGQVLVQIEPSAFRARELQAEANVAKAEAALLDAKRALARSRELLPQNYISQADVDAAEATYAQRQADLKQARAALEVAQVDLANTTIRAPIDGVVVSRSVDLGQTVAASLQAPRLFVIANDLARMQVETRISEADIGRIAPGQSASFTVDAFPELPFEGEVDQVRLEPIVDQNVVTYTTVIRTANPELKLRPGMTANVTVLVDRRDGVWRAPNAALRFVPPASPGAERGSAMASTSTQASGEARGSGAVDPAPRGRPGGPPGGGGRGGAAMRGGAGDPPGGSGADPHARRAGASAAPPMQHLYVLREGKPVRVAVRAGLSDGTLTEVGSDELQEGDRIIVGLEQSRPRANLQPPPGMGGGGPLGGGGRRR